jgi:hypothetical protein
VSVHSSDNCKIATCAGLSVTRELNFSVDQIIMTCQKMALLALAAGLLCMSALLNGAEASVSARNSSWKLIDTLHTSCCWTDGSLVPVCSHRLCVAGMSVPQICIFVSVSSDPWCM